MESWLEPFLDSASRRSAEVAHDLKTPLNIAVLNLELARLKLRRITEVEDDEPISAYLRSVEGELRRIARIFDAYFVYSVPPAERPKPDLVNPDEVVEGIFVRGGFGYSGTSGIRVRIHQDRLQVLSQNLYDGIRALLVPETVSAAVSSGEGRWLLSVTGRMRREDEELSKVFKFYYTDVSGSPELGLATARLISETYGGSLNAAASEGGLTVTLALPAGDE